MNLPVTEEYQRWLLELKATYRNAAQKAIRSVNASLVEFYWVLGREIEEKEQGSAWGSGFLRRLSEDLTQEFPEIKGFSYRNLRLIRQWYRFYEGESENWQQLVAKLAQVPWGHNIKIVSQCDSVPQALYYVEKTLQNGWSRAVLVHQLELRLWQRSGQATTNFETTLPDPQSDLAAQTLKDPYLFDFLSLSNPHSERELEGELIEHITAFLLELGEGFAFVGKQVHLEVGGEDFYPDLLFYHLELRCYVVIELKVTDFKPEYAGQINFYCTAVDELKRKEADNPTIGILLCKSRNRMIVEFALKAIDAPIGVSEYQLVQSLPSDLQDKLPGIDALEEELSRDMQQSEYEP